MKPEKLLLEFEEIIAQMGYRLRKERGNFRGANCVLDGDKLIVLNKNQPAEVHLGLLARFIEEHNHDDFFIKPAVRKELEKIWNLQSPRKAPELEFNDE